jgi:peptidoglycan/xylan/chitin deacetylase (PgdA/CDA1 family)
MKWRGGLKAAVESGFVYSRLPDLWRLGRRRGVLILAYHNIIPDSVAAGGDSSLHLRRATFASQLDLLCDTCDVIPLERALQERAGPSRRPQAVITFDDAYRGAMTVGIQEVVDRGLPATVFVAPAFVGGRFFWWDALTPRGAPAPTDAFRARALNECRGMDEAVRRWAEECGCQTQTLHDAVACASLEELHAAAAKPGITFASHSWSHPNLPRLTATELDTELSRPLVWLRERFDRALPVLSYPYGLSSLAVEGAAAAAGYKAGVLVGGGWASAPVRDLFALPRLNVPAGLSRNGFVLRASGLLNH